MVAAAMERAVTLGTLLLPLPKSTGDNRTRPQSTAVFLRRDPNLRLSGDPQQLFKRWSSGSVSRQHLDLRRVSSRKCGLKVMAVGQQQAARDRVVHFGKCKGAMLGTLTSRYLRWMAKNMKSGPLSEWSEYAEEVLADPYYKDRLEWEKVEKLMTQAHDIGSITGNRDVVLAPARMYGWDLQDDVGWRKVNFSLIGTTKGGRIPRVKGGVQAVVPEKKKPAPPRKKSMPVRTTMLSTRTQTPSPIFASSASAVDDSSSPGSLREELMRRRAQRRERMKSKYDGLLEGYDETAEAQRSLKSKFPGRESLLSKVRSYDISE